MPLTSWQPPRLFRKIFRVPTPALLLLGLVSIYWYRICVQDGACSSGRIWTQEPRLENEELGIQLGSMPDSANNISVNLVMATVIGDDISWTKKVSIPNLNIVQYFADGQKKKTPYHPPKNKGREATMYHTYFYDFYDSLPDISIMIHAHETPWHVEAVLDSKMSYTLSQLDLAEVQRRGYVNLRVGWDDGCPDWIDTSKSAEDSRKTEEPHMHHSILEIFSPPANDSSVSTTLIEVPHILGAPCCSQFALTRDAIRSIPREDYRRYREWLLNTDLSDYVSGRVWEHVWQWVYTGKAVDCPIEWKTYCRLYHICFTSPAELRTFVELGWEASNLEERVKFWKELLDPQEGEKARQRIKEIQKMKAHMKSEALKRGQNPQWRLEVINDIYND